MFTTEKHRLMRGLAEMGFEITRCDDIYRLHELAKQLTKIGASVMETTGEIIRDMELEYVVGVMTERKGD